MSNHIFTGSGVALITPMKSDGSVNYDVLGDLVEFHVQNGTDAIIVCGTTGEAATLSKRALRNNFFRCRKDKRQNSCYCRYRQ